MTWESDFQMTFINNKKKNHQMTFFKKVYSFLVIHIIRSTIMGKDPRTDIKHNDFKINKGAGVISDILLISFL